MKLQMGTLVVVFGWYGAASNVAFREGRELGLDGSAKRHFRSLAREV